MSMNQDVLGWQPEKVFSAVDFAKPFYKGRQIKSSKKDVLFQASAMAYFAQNWSSIKDEELNIACVLFYLPIDEETMNRVENDFGSKVREIVVESRGLRSGKMTASQCRHKEMAETVVVCEILVNSLNISCIPGTGLLSQLDESRNLLKNMKHADKTLVQHTERTIEGEYNVISSRERKRSTVHHPAEG